MTDVCPENLGKESAVHKAQEKAKSKVLTDLMESLPKSAGAIEKAYPSLRNDSETFYQYMKRMPLSHVEQIFKKSEVQAEVMSGILNAFAELGAQACSLWRVRK